MIQIYLDILAEAEPPEPVHDMDYLLGGCRILETMGIN
jgi:hypothetical protein